MSDLDRETPKATLGSVLGKHLIESFRLRVEEAIIAEINDQRVVADERSGLRMARIILNREAKRFIGE